MTCSTLVIYSMYVQQFSQSDYPELVTCCGIKLNKAHFMCIDLNLQLILG